MAVICVPLVLASTLSVGLDATFGPETPARIPILALIAAVVLTPIVWSAAFRSGRYGLTLTDDELVVVSWWRTRRFGRAELSAAEPLPAVMRLSDGFFSGGGTDAAPFAVWLWPSNPEGQEFPVGVTTGPWEATAAAAHRINAWLGVEIDFGEVRADMVRDGD